MADPVSWLIIEPGWTVVAADGTEVGHVDRLIGDTTNDSFKRNAVSKGILRATRYVPAERVAAITEGRVELDLSAAAVEELDEYNEPPASAEIIPPDRRS